MDDDHEAVWREGGSPVRSGNIFADLPAAGTADELIEVLATRAGVRIERIVSTGQATADGEWYDQDTEEWVVVVSGAARLRIAGEGQDRLLGPGDWVRLPAHCRHRVTWTEATPPTVWIAVHIDAGGGAEAG